MWKTVKLGDACLVRRGTTITKKNAIEGDVPVIGGGTKPTYFHNEPNREASCITISGSGASAGFVNRWDLPIFASDCSTVEPKDKMQLPKFIYYYLLSQQQFIYDNFRSGAAQPHVYAKDIETLDFLILPLLEQERIVAKLDAAFAEIDEAIENIGLKDTKLDQFKSKIISDSFIDNDWDSKMLGDCITYEKKNAKGSSLPYVGMENITSQSMDLIGEIAIPEKPKSSFHFNKRHVLFGRLRPYLRKVLVPNFEGQCSNEIFCIKPKENIIREFLAYWLLEQKVSSKIEATSTGTRMPRANMNALLEFDFPIPSIKEQKIIVSKLDLIFEKNDRAKKTLVKSKANFLALKSALLAQELQSGAPA